MCEQIRAAGESDIGEVLALWKSAQVEPGHTDDEASLRLLIAGDPGALMLAETGDGDLAGCVIAGWDGWRGTIYRLAVAPAYRRRGLAGRLLAAAEERLAGLGAVRMQAIVVGSDERATSFWRASHWHEQADRLRFTNG